MSDRLRIGLLGSLTAERSDGDQLELASAVQRRLLSILALQDGHVLSADRLGDLLDCSPGSLRTVVSRLRGRVGAERVRTSPPGYALVATTDIAEFEQLLASASTARGAVAIELLDRAIGLWRGEALEEFRDEPWAVAEVARVDELHATAIELRAETMVAEGLVDHAIAEMRAHVLRYPLRERPHAILMQALARDGRSTEALRVYQDLRHHLVTDVGTEPSEALRSTEAAIAAGTVDASEPGTVTPMEQRGFLAMLVVPATSDPADPSERVHVSTVVEEVLTAAISANHGIVIATGIGADAAAFDVAADAVAAAVDAHQVLARTTGWTPDRLEVRMGVHFGPAVRRDDRWYGPTLDEVHRMADVGHDGQIIVSEVVASMLDSRLIDLGEHRLRDVVGMRRLFQVDVPGRTNQFPSLRSVGSYQTTLPAQRTVLIGRDDLVVRVRALLGEHRLVSLLGPGGVGKTRLAIEVAGQALGGFPGGVFFADLTRAANDGDVTSEILRSMKSSARESQPESDAIGELLRERAALLVIDNCEHVIDGAAEVIDELLAAAPATRVLATSREPLALHGERRLIVPSLDADGPTSSAVRLFTDRAMAIDERAGAGDADLAAIVEIARRLDGIPLAIELAAAQVATLAPSTILHHLDDRFALLTSTLRRVPRRQQTLAATVAWSYDLLDPQQQRAFRLLSHCAGPFSPSTAARALGLGDAEAAGLLDALRSKSLLVEVNAGGDHLGFTFLETLRAYGRERSSKDGDADAARCGLERALLPVGGFDDWTVLVNEYLAAPAPSMLIEETTRLAAGNAALIEDRVDHAAFILGSVAYRDDAGGLQARSAIVRSLTARHTDLDPTAWLVARATELLLARSARDYGTCLEVAAAVLDALEPGNPARCWFELWQCALITAIDPRTGLDQVDAVLEDARRHAHPPLDWTVSQLLATRATGLALLHRLEEADRWAAEAAEWAPVGRESRDQILALRLWIGYLRGEAIADGLAPDVAGQTHDLGLAELCAAPGALCGGGTIDERASRLVEVARRRPKLDIPTPFLLAFAWLAIEEQDPDRARALLATAEMYDSSTAVALLYALASVEDWSPERWDQGRDAMAGQYLSAEQDEIVKAGTSTLAEEVRRWERRLDERRDAPRPGVPLS